MPHTRDAEIQDIRERLKSIAIDCVASDLIEPAKSLLAASEFCATAADQLAQRGEGETPYPGPSPMTWERRDHLSKEAREVLRLNSKGPAEEAPANPRSDANANSDAPAR
jgi:hypothetical protein